MSKISEQITIKDPVIEALPEDQRKPSVIVNSCVQMLEEKVDGVADSG